MSFTGTVQFGPIAGDGGIDASRRPGCNRGAHRATFIKPERGEVGYEEHETHLFHPGSALPRTLPRPGADVGVVSGRNIPLELQENRGCQPRDKGEALIRGTSITQNHGSGSIFEVCQVRLSLCRDECLVTWSISWEAPSQHASRHHGILPTNRKERAPRPAVT